MRIDRIKAHKDTEEFGIAGYLDVETTGLSPFDHEVIEFALALFKYNRASGEIIGIVDQYVGLREPERNIPSSATSVHGLTFEDVCGKQLDEVRIEGMFEQAEFLIAHNASFDRGFVTRLFPKAGEKTWLCSMRGVKWRHLGFSSAALQNLLHWHGIKPAQAHRAEADVLCAIKLLSHKRADGTSYFQELLKALPQNTDSHAG
ncbi:MAG TPA: exonuclease domain-containing protein [Verrucomicrobiae bacterium]|nr:exonuclease domain-containing protein [Verrucomicrobiae bacterium]